MPSPTRLVPLAVLAVAALGLLHPAPAGAQRRARLTEESLVPTEVFPADQGRRFAYPNGFDVLYYRTENGHVWKLTERSVTTTPPPTPTPGEGEEATPAPTPEPTPTPGPDDLTDGELAPTHDEQAFVEEVGLVRPTLVTMVFTDSAATAQGLAQTLFEDKGNAAARPPNLAVLELEPDKVLGAGSFKYLREYNLGDRAGGVRRAAMLVAVKGPVFVQVDAELGLKDGYYDSELDTLEKRAREVLGWLLRLL
jgi:hypothetical protein